jgi:hypothetical protein
MASAVPTAPAADYPILLPGDYVAAAAAQTGPGVSAAAMATPGRLVLSRPGKRLVGLTLGIGAATPVDLFALFFVQAVQAPSASPAPGSVPAVAAVPAPSTAAATPAPAPSSAAPAPVPRTVRWLNGLSLLSTDMTRAMGPGNQVLTNVSLRTTARQLGRCSAELSALGPPAAQLRHLHRLAVRACQGFERGAGYFAAAARFMGPDGSATDQSKVNKLLDRGNAGVNRGSYLISRAVADGSFIGSPV